MNILSILILTLFFACTDVSEEKDARVSPEITNPIFIEMFKEYQSIIDDYEAIVSNLDTDNFNNISEIESISKRATLWVNKWEEEIKKANLSNKEKNEIINEYEILLKNYRK